MVNETNKIEIFIDNDLIILRESDDIELICEDDSVSIPDEILKVMEYIFEPIREYILIDIQFLKVISEMVHKAKLKYEENQLKKQLLAEIENLLDIFRAYDISTNSLFIKGALVYCRKILQRYYNIDSMEIDIIVTNISFYVKEITELDMSVENKDLADLNLNKFEQKFDKIQELSNDFGLFPRLDDENLDLALLLDKKHEYKHSKMLTNPL